MRKTILLLLLLLTLTGCTLLPQPPPATPAPPLAGVGGGERGFAPSPTPQYYPAVEAEVVQAILNQSEKPVEGRYTEIDQEGRKVKVLSFGVFSSGRREKKRLAGFEVDLLWVYERNAVGVVQYPLVLGVQEGESYTPFYVYAEKRQRQAYLADLGESGLLERGHRLFPVLSGEFVDRKGIDWGACGEAVFCRLGRSMQETYDMDALVINQLAGQIPQGWLLAWPWDAATAWNADPNFIQIDLP